MTVDVIRHVVDEGRIEYVFSDDATEWEKVAVREYGVRSKDEVQDALDWRAALDEADTVAELKRIQRGKHPTADEDIGRPNSNSRNP